VLGTLVLAILAGHKLYAHVTALRGDAVAAQALGMQRAIWEAAEKRRSAASNARVSRKAWQRRRMLGSITSTSRGTYERCTRPLETPRFLQRHEAGFAWRQSSWTR
jgi:hypothetical protein